MNPIPSFLVATLARSDLARLSSEMYDLQRQTGSGHIAADLKGYGDEAGRIVSGRTMIAQGATRVDAANKLLTRLDVQDTVLGHAAGAAAQLKQDIMTALTSDNGTYLSSQLDTAWGQISQAINTRHEGVALFAGDRRAFGNPVTAQSPADLTQALSTGTLFDESTRESTVDLGFGAPVKIADKASTFSASLFGVLGDLQAVAVGAGQPLSDDTRNRLLTIVRNLDGAHQQVVDAQARNGDTQARVQRGIDRLTAQNDLLAKHLGQTTDSDLAEVAMKLSAAQTQYQAAAKVFAQIKDLSLINFLGN